MGQSNDLFIENILLKNIDEYIPINIDLSTIPEKNSASTVRRISTTISKTKRYINQMYDETVRSELRKEILIELRQRFLAEKKTVVIIIVVYNMEILEYSFPLGYFWTWGY